MTEKRPSRSCQDWHPADIKAALAKKGYTLFRVARENGYAERSPSKALTDPWPAIERIIADILCEKPSNIWPSRYDSNGNPLGRRGHNHSLSNVHRKRISIKTASGNA